jgi:hypothetical protein
MSAELMRAEAERNHAAKQAAEWAERGRAATGILDAHRADREAAAAARNAERWQRQLDELEGGPTAQDGGRST